MVKSIEERIEDNRKELINYANKVIQLAGKQDFQENLHYIEQAINGIFQYGTVLVKDTRTLVSNSTTNKTPTK